ncbi:MAG: SdrD B-like domain-containing protein [Anaerolineae bacterium]|jgi:hypothetical protein
MRKLIVVTIALGATLFALSLHSLSTAEDSAGPRVAPSAFESPIDPPYTIRGTAFDDTNVDGDLSAGEPGIQGVTISLEGDSIDGMITTDPNGDYWFALGWPGIYTVTAVTPVGYANTTPQSGVAEFNGSDEQVTINFGYRPSGIYLPLVSLNYP